MGKIGKTSDVQSNLSQGKIKFLHTIKGQLIVLNIILFILFNTITALNLRSLQQTVATAESEMDYLTSTYQLMEEAQNDVSKVGLVMDEYVITGENLDSTLESIENRGALAQEAIDTLVSNAEMGGNEELISIMESVSTSFEEYLTLINQAMEYAENGDTESAAALISGDLRTINLSMDESWTSIEEMLEEEVATGTATIEAAQRSSIRTTILGVVVFIVFIWINFLLNNKLIVRKIKHMTAELNEMISSIRQGHGDLTARITTDVSSELVYLKEGINLYVEALQVVMKEVKDGVVVLEDSAIEINEKVGIANDSVTNTSAALEELSASMETVSSNALTINDTLSNVKEASLEIGEDVENGNETAAQIKTEAQRIQEEVVRRKQDTINEYTELSKVLEGSVEDAKQVNQIEELTNVIMEIAAQTNLLSLNASIEAARAGDAGKGFSVVASEISTLADNSKKTASDIQEITMNVTNAVKTLSTNATRILEFINSTVVPDYDAFVETGNKYEDTAELMKTMLDGFMEKTEHLSQNMLVMSDAVEDITSAVQESSKAINMSAANSTEIVSQMDLINQKINLNTEVTDNLNKSTEKFEKV